MMVMAWILIIGMIILGIVIGVGLVMRQERRQRQLVAQIRRDWQRQPGPLRAGPVSVWFYGDDLVTKRVYSGSVFGVLGVWDEAVMLALTKRGSNVRIPISNIHWVGTDQIKIRVSDDETKTHDALILHFEHPANGRWRMMVLVAPEPKTLVRIIAECAGLTDTLHGSRQTLVGPARATLLHQDIYGKWHPASDPDLHAGHADLHLVPNRVLFDQRTWLHLAQIRELDIYYSGTADLLNPFNEKLLRIAYDDNDDQRAVIGFLTRRAESMGHAISIASGVPVNVHTGRKKK